MPKQQSHACKQLYINLTKLLNLWDNYHEKIFTCLVIGICRIGNRLPKLDGDICQAGIGNSSHSSFGNGQKLTGVIVDYDKAVKPSTIKAADFTVQDRTVLDVAKVADKQALISLDSNDANASLLVKQSNSNTGTGNSGGNGSRGVGQAGDKNESGPSVNPTNPTVTYSTHAGKQSLTISARDNLVVDDFVQRSYQDSATGKTVKYNLYIPKNYSPNKSYPLVLFMHDAGVTGSNVLSTLIQSNGATTWATPEFQAKHPAFVLAPQYDEIIADDNSNSSLYLDATINLIDNLDK